MKNKLIFRILGALASALIIVAVFVPFISVTGYTTSLWESFELTGSLYLPIMIIIFGAIGVIFFALNIKTELAYMSAGAIAFFVVMETVDILNQGVFETLSIGYYFLVIGALLTGIMAFLTNLKPKKKEDKVEIEQATEPSMLDQIDKLYNDQPLPQNEISPIQPIENNIEPIPVQPVPTPVQPIENVVSTQPIEQVSSVVQEQPIQEVTPVQLNSVPVEPQSMNTPPVNPVLQEFSNPVVQEFSTSAVQPTTVQPIENVVPTQQIEQVNSVVQDQSAIVSEPLTNSNEQVPVNPVIQEFTNPSSTSINQSNTNELDIFGQQ